MHRLLTTAMLSLALVALADVSIDLKNSVICARKGDKNIAVELKTHLDLIGSAKIPIIYDAPASKGAYVFYIAKQPDDQALTYKPEEARWSVRSDATYFYGDKDGKGHVFAVYSFLEDALGVRWPGGTDIAFKPLNPVKVTQTEGTWIPELRQRLIRGNTPGMGIWRSRLRAGGHDRPQYGHAFVKWWSRFGKDHPEYFAMNNGKRGPVHRHGNKEDVAAFNGPSGQMVAMCVSNQDVVKQVIADWDSKTNQINICENDAEAKDSCQCDACMALDHIPEGVPRGNNLGDRYVNFANRVLAEALKLNPNAKVNMYAYNASEQAPYKERLQPQITIGIVPVDFRIPSLQQYVDSWRNAGMTEFFYRPNRHHYYGYGDIPFGYEKHFFDVICCLKKSGAIGFDYDSPGCMNTLQWFADYVIFKFMQDPTKTFEYWEDHYMQAYGNAAEDVKQYYRFWRENIWEKRVFPNLNDIVIAGKFNNFARGLTWNLGQYYKEEDFKTASLFLEKALSRQGLEDNERARLNKLVMAHKHAELTFRAIAHKTDEDSIALRDFRIANNLPLKPWHEGYWGDVCGIARVEAFKDYKPPFVQTSLFWQFKLDPQNAGTAQEWFKNNPEDPKVWDCLMPTNSAWENPNKSYIHPSKEMRGKLADYDGIAWYATSITIPPEWKGKREVYLYFGAVDEAAWVYLNGKLLGEHPFVKPDDWNTPFSFRIDDKLDWNAKKHSVVVKVQDNSGAGGIWKRVWILSK